VQTDPAVAAMSSRAQRLNTNAWATLIFTKRKASAYVLNQLALRLADFPQVVLTGKLKAPMIARMLCKVLPICCRRISLRARARNVDVVLARQSARPPVAK
jgi:hypothetical protein